MVGLVWTLAVFKHGEKTFTCKVVTEGALPYSPPFPMDWEQPEERRVSHLPHPKSLLV